MKTSTVTPSSSAADDKPQWAKDFPINVGQDNYVARRDFTKFMVLTSFAFVVGQFCIGIKDTLLGRKAAVGRLAIARVNQVPAGSTLSFVYPEEHDTCLLIRQANGDFLAYSQKCTHLSCAVIPHLEEGRIHCPCHEGVFDLPTGRPIAGPPRRPLPRITLEIRRGTIYATGVEVSTV
jgi:Rieske Fe-S protein